MPSRPGRLAPQASREAGRRGAYSPGSARAAVDCPAANRRGPRGHASRRERIGIRRRGAGLPERRDAGDVLRRGPRGGPGVAGLDRFATRRFAGSRPALFDGGFRMDELGFGQQAAHERRYGEAAAQYRQALEAWSKARQGPSRVQRLAPQPDLALVLTETGGALLLAGDAAAAIATLDAAAKADPGGARISSCARGRRRPLGRRKPP